MVVVGKSPKKGFMRRRGVHWLFCISFFLSASMYDSPTADAFTMNPRTFSATRRLPYNPSVISRQNFANERSKQIRRVPTTAIDALPTSIARIASPLLSLSVMGSIIMFHECGHYLAARWFRIEVLEFSIGVGPKLLGFNAFGNAFSVRALPLGGYVKFAGEEDDHEDEAIPKPHTDLSRWLANRPWWERAVVLSGGVLFNFLLSFLLYFGAMSHWNQHASNLKVARATILYMRQLIPATAMGIGGVLWDIVSTVAASIGYFWIALFRKMLSFIWKAPTLAEPLSRATTMVDPLGQLSGPIEVIKMGSDVAYHRGIARLLFFAGDLSLHLGVVNAMPLPILDGGRLIFLLWEAITKRKVDPRVELTANTLTTLLLLWLFAFMFVKEASFLMMSR